jgi:signal transduction histidine kinase
VALDRPRDAADYQATLAAVREQAHRLGRLSGDLLLLARADAPAEAITIERLDLSELLPAIVALVEPLATAHKQTIVLAPMPRLPVQGNEDQLIRLILNLLDNALRYTPPGGRVRLAGASDGVHVTIGISDSGPGIAPEQVPQLFDRFFRGDSARTRAQGGSGLGLAIAQSIAHAHGGRITVESAIGRGSTFTVVLPAAPPPQPPTQPPSSRVDSRTSHDVDTEMISR